MTAFDDAASYFLDGIPAPNTPEMRAAVKAWLKHESGTRIRGNNPWNLHIGPSCPTTSRAGIGGLNPSQAITSTVPGVIGNRYAGTGDRNVAIFDTLRAGVNASIANLRSHGSDFAHYDRVLAAARTGAPIAFLDALAASAWSAGRYGTANGGPNVLISVYRSLIDTTPKEENVILKANSPKPVHSLVDVKKGGQVYRLDGTPLVKWSADATVTSLGQSGKFEVIVVTTSGVTQYALTDNVSNRRSTTTITNTPQVPPPVLETAPPPLIPAFVTAPAHIPARQPDPFQFGAWTAAWEPDTSAWVTSGLAGKPVCLLIHGGPIAADNLGGMDNLAGWLAIRGAKAIAVRYPTLNVTFTQAMAPLRAAVTKYKPDVIVAHSLGGYFGGILAYETGLPLVLLAADDTPGDTYRTALGGPLAHDEMPKSKGHVTVITASNDGVATVAENQALVSDLAASGHPGRWIILDGADHNSILSDVGALDAILA